MSKTSTSTPPVALVTGGSRRLGRAIALRLAQDGHDLALHYRSDRAGAEDVANAAEEFGARTHVLRADLKNLDAVAQLHRDAEHALGPIDVVVNNAAVFAGRALDEMTLDDFDLHMDVNARAVYALSLIAGRAMVARHAEELEAGLVSPDRAIINLSCVSAARAWARFVAYSASKAAVSNLTVGFARALAPAVRVNAIAPGPVLPPAGEPPEAGDAAVAKTLLKRWGQPTDIAAAAAFLLRARYVTGVVLHVDGGRSIN